MNTMKHSHQHDQQEYVEEESHNQNEEICSEENCWCVSSNWLPGASTRTHIETMITVL